MRKKELPTNLYIFSVKSETRSLTKRKGGEDGVGGLEKFRTAVAVNIIENQSARSKGID